MTRVRSILFLLLSLLFALAGLTRAACAQTRIEFLSTFATHGPVPADCAQEGDLVRKEINLYDHPASWRWIIACDEPAWKRVEAHMGQESTSSFQILAATDLETRMTYIRGWALIHPLAALVDAQPDHTIRHELGHILARSHNEVMAEKYARDLLTRRNEEEALNNELKRKSQTLLAANQTE